MASSSKRNGLSTLQKLGHVSRSRRARRTGIVIAVVVVLFGLLGFFAAPPLIRHVAEQQLSRQLDRPATIGRVSLNPYTLRLAADEVHIGEHGGQDSFVDIGQLVVRASWTSLLRLAPIVAEVRITAPRITIVRYDAQRFNFTDLVDKFSQPSPQSGPQPAPPAKSEPMRFALSNIRIADGRIAFDDRLLNVRHVIDQFSLDLPLVANLPSNLDVFVEPKLQARLDGSPFALGGKTRPFAPGLESSIQLKIDGLDVPALLSYAPSALPLAVPAGKLSSDLTLDFAMPNGAPTVKLSGSVDLTDARITSPANEPLIAFRALHVAAADVEPLHDILHFDDIRIDQPVISLARDGNGALNVMKLAASGGAAEAPAVPSASAPATVPAAPAAAPPPAANGQAGPLDLAIRRLAVNDGALQLNDAASVTPAALSLAHIALTLADFSLTGTAPATYTLSSDVGTGGSIKADGTVNLAAGRARTRLVIDALALPVIQPYLAGATSAHLTAGTLGASINANADWSKAPFALLLSDSTLDVKSLQVALAAAKTPALAVADANLKIAKIDLAASDAEIANVEVAGLAINAERLADGRIDLAALAGPPPAARPAHGAQPATAPAQAASPAWHYRIDAVDLKDAAANFTDHTTRRPVKLAVAPLQLNLRQFSDDLSKPVAFKLAATLNHKGSLDLSGEVTAQPLKIGLTLASNRLDLAAFDPYLGDALKATIASAIVNAKGNLAFERTKHAMRASYKGDAALVDVRMLDRVSSDPFAGWRSLALANVKAGYDSVRGTDVDVARVTFANFYGHLLLDAQGRLSLQDVIAPENAAPPSTAADEAAKETPAPAAAEETRPPLKLHVGQIVLQNGRATYTDNFIKPNYTADLVAIKGTIGAIGTDTAAPAPIDIGAQLSANGPIAITGAMNPLADRPSLDVTAGAKDIELTNLTPYSAKYAGYPITKGKLNVDLHYQLDNDQLSANNHIFIDQLTFGEHVDNDTATSLPVRLAIALLKDPEGRIDVNIPVSGSLSNPEFSVSGVIWQAVVNLLEKAITSPFTLLASAFGDDGGADLGYVEFAPGTADLTDASRGKLDTVAKMLADKPSVSVDVIGRVDPDKDLPGLRTAFVESQVKRQNLDEVVGKGESIDPATVTVTPAERSKYLARAYGAADFEKPRNFIGLEKGLPDDEMTKALADHAPVNAASLRTLAQARAEAVRQYLDGKIDAARLFVVAPKLDAKDIQDKGATTRVDFALK